MAILALVACKDRNPPSPKVSQVFPNLPLPPNATLVSRSGGTDALQITLRSSAKAKDVEKYYDRIEARLAANEAAGGKEGFVVGEAFTVVDVLVYLFWRWAKHLDFEKGMPERWPRFAEVARQVEMLEGTKVAMEVEKQGLWFPRSA